MQIYDRAKRIAAGSVLTGILILGGCGQQTATGGPPQGGPPEVAVVTVQPQQLVITTELTGRTSANLVAEVRPQVGGIIQKRLFTEGSDVKAGQVLYQIDPAPFQAALDNAAKRRPRQVLRPICRRHPAAGAESPDKEALRTDKGGQPAGPTTTRPAALKHRREARCPVTGIKATA